MTEQTEQQTKKQIKRKTGAMGRTVDVAPWRWHRPILLLPIYIDLATHAHHNTDPEPYIEFHRITIKPLKISLIVYSLVKLFSTFWLAPIGLGLSKPFRFIAR